MNRFNALAFALVFVAGCADEFSSDTNGGIATAVELNRWGSADGHDALTRVADIAVLPDGRIAVAQPMEGTIRVLSPDGAPITTIGRRGRGPGEFTSLSSIGWDGTVLWAYDMAALRVSRFDSSGTFLHTVAPRTSLKGSFVPLADGFLVIPNVGAESATEPSQSLALIGTDTTGSRTDTIGFMNFPSPVSVRVERAGSRTYMTAPIQDYTLVAVSPDGGAVVFVDREPPTGPRAYATITTVDFRGDTLWNARVEGTPVPVEDDFVDRMMGDVAASMPGGNTEEMARLFRENMVLPAFYPLTDQVVVAADGSVWIRHTPGADAKLATWQHVTATGTDTQKMLLPSGVKVYHVQNDTFYGVEPDSLDVPYVVRMGRKR